MKMNEEELKELSNNFQYSNLFERYKVLEREFNIQEGETVIDGGAFHGDMALYFSKKVGENGKVFSFEPLYYNYTILKNFITTNRLDNVIPIQIGLWNKDEKLKFYESDDINAGSYISNFIKVKPKYIISRGVKLDSICKRYHIDKVDHIWTNIEGAEVNFLKGAKDTILNNHCKICISTHKVNSEYETKYDVIDVLESYGYKCKILEDHTGWVYGEPWK